MPEQRADEVGPPMEASPSATELLGALRGIARANDSLEWEFARRGDLRLLEHIALEYVMSASLPIGPGELSSRVGMSTGSGTELVDRLVRAGHLERHPHPRDGRRIVLRVTAATAARLRLERAPLTAAIGALSDSLDGPEVVTITTYLRRAEEIITAHTSAGLAAAAATDPRVAGVGAGVGAGVVPAGVDA